MAASLHAGKFAFLKNGFNEYNNTTEPLSLTSISIGVGGFFNSSAVEYDPFEDRRFAQGMTTHLVTRRAIQAGQQILMNDLTHGDFIQEDSLPLEDVLSQLKDVCAMGQPACSFEEECQCHS